MENNYCTWKLANKIWKIPENGKEGYISNDAEVLAYEDNKVILKEKTSKTEYQKWFVSSNNSDGWFTIKHQATGKYLTTEDSESGCDAALKSKFQKKVSIFLCTFTNFYFYFSEFIPQRFIGIFTAGDLDDLNVGGITDLKMNDRIKGCTGEAVVTPRFKRGDIK